MRAAAAGDIEHHPLCLATDRVDIFGFDVSNRRGVSATARIKVDVRDESTDVDAADGEIAAAGFEANQHRGRCAAQRSARTQAAFAAFGNHAEILRVDFEIKIVALRRERAVERETQTARRNIDFSQLQFVACHGESARAASGRAAQPSTQALHIDIDNPAGTETRSAHIELKIHFSRQARSPLRRIDSAHRTAELPAVGRTPGELAFEIDDPAQSTGEDTRDVEFPGP